MADANISKNDLENVCQALGISTEGVKSDLVQRLRKHLKGKNRAFSHESEESYRSEGGNSNTQLLDDGLETTEMQNLSSQAKTLKELAYQSRKGNATGIPPTREQSSTPSIRRSEPTHAQTENKKKRPLPNEEDGDQDLISNQMLIEFKRLENAMININDKLNTVTAQVQDTRHKVEVNEVWQKHKFEKARDQHEYDALCKIGKELDLAMESRSTVEVVNHIDLAREIAANRIFTLRVAEEYGWDIASALPDTQDNWLKGKDSLIEKAKTLVEVKKTKRQRIYESSKSSNFGRWNDAEKFFRTNYRQKTNSFNKCYICNGLGHYANECPSDPNRESRKYHPNYQSKGYTTYYNKYKNYEDRNRDERKLD
ncbi:15970_t:CDS:1 [Acaulospora morrowiae]|uniref:15970_t:CDS:1 n=1 Tax=Acaulospora morrowiae TaxID=94023 RepID=A0A9N9GUK9_9GLOM|nr:15970_t:CDS:1 [Acaulospora morrowiae]